MTYTEANRLLQGRCHHSRKVANNTYLVRAADGIHLRLHSTDIIIWRPDGRIRATVDGWDTRTTRNRLSRFLPLHSVASGGSEFGSAVAVLYRPGWKPSAILDPAVEIGADGHVSPRCAAELEACRLSHRADVNAIRRARYQERFWILKARTGSKLRRPLTLEMVQAERNISTRTAMIKVYGLERFLAAVNAKTLDTLGKYALLSYDMDSRSSIRALKMVCPSTRVVYIHPVDPSCSTVSAALDWMFQTPGYLTRLAAEA